MFEEYNADKLHYGSKKIIHEMVRKNVDEEIIKYATQLNKDEQPVFYPGQMEQILLGIINKLSFEDVKKYALIHNGQAVYNAGQMNVIKEGMLEGLPEELINIYAKLNANMEPIYDQNQMYSIKIAIRNKVPMKYIEKMTQLNKNNEPSYDWDQMQQISVGFQVNLSEEQMEYFTKTDDSGCAVYPGSTMRYIINAFEKKMPIEYIEIFTKFKDEKPISEISCVTIMYNNIAHYFVKGEFNRINQIKEYVNDELEFKEIEPLVGPTFSIDKSRILRSFYSLDASVDDIKRLIAENVSYGDLKEIKYLLQCAKEFNLTSNPILDEKINSIEEKRIVLSKCIAGICGASYEEDKKISELINRCLSYKMPPEQINFITNNINHFYYDQMKDIAVGLLNGLTVEEIHTEIYKNNLTARKPLSEVLENAVRVKFNDISNIDVGIEYDTSLLDDIER